MIDLTRSRPLGSTDLAMGGLGLGVALLGNLHHAKLIPAEALLPLN